MERLLNCSSCCQELGLKYQARGRSEVQHVYHIPLLLRCGHSFCEDCLNRRVKQERVAISCPTCKISTRLLVEGSLAALPPDIYRLGIVTLAKSKHHSWKLGTKFMKRTGTSKHNETKETENVRKEPCFECITAKAALKCLHCNVVLCASCYDRLHQNSRALRTHVTVPLYQDEGLSTMSTVCSQHNDRPLEYFCEADQLALCSHCIIDGPHQTHAVITLERKNQSAVDGIDDALKTAGDVLLRLRHSEKTMATVIPSIRQKMMETYIDVRFQFLQLHALLERRESAILAELDEAFVNEIQPLDTMKSNLREDAKLLNVVIKDATKAKCSQQGMVVNAQQILSRLQLCEEKPCMLSVKLESTAATRLVIEEKAVEALSTVGHVEIDRFVNVDMISWKDSAQVDGDYEDIGSVLTTMTDDSDSTTTTRSCLSRSTSVNEDVQTDGLSSSPTSPEPPDDHIPDKRPVKTYKPPRVSKAPMMVIVTHIKHPCSFSAQSTEGDAFNKLSYKIQSHCLHPETASQVPTSIAEGEAVLAQYTGDNTWYRGLVKSVIVNDPDPTKAKANILFVDYGNNEDLPVARMRIMPSRLMYLPAQAFPASLVDIKSTDPSGQWSTEAVHMFCRMIDNKPVLLRVYSCEDSVYKVDLCKPVSDDNVDSRPVSVRDALVFVEQAILLPNVDGIIHAKPPKPTRQYLLPTPLRQGEIFDCQLSHVENPSCLYIQKGGQEREHLITLMKELQKVYGDNRKKLWSIFYPQLYMICVAEYEEDGQWYRARVIRVPGRCLVDVLYVDYGNIERVHYTKLRAIQPSFTTMPPAARPCSLADVAPEADGNWSSEAVAVLKSYFCTELRAKITSTSGGIPQLMLFTPEGVCIKTQLVLEGLVSGLGQNSLEEDPLGIEEDVMGQIAADNKGNEPKARSKGESKKKKNSERFVNEPSYMKCNVTYIENPGHFYVQLASAPKDGLDSLMATLPQIYATSDSPEDTHWEVDDFCAVPLQPDKKWFRATILEDPVGKANVKVRSIDYGLTEVVAVSSLRSLSDECSEKPFALRVHLPGVQPAGDPNRWSATSIDYFKEILNDDTVYFVPMGEKDKGSCPCDLLKEHIIPGTALTPEMAEYKKVTDMLMDRGVALPNRRLTRQTSGQNVTVAPKVEKPSPPKTGGAETKPQMSKKPDSSQPKEEKELQNDSNDVKDVAEPQTDVKVGGSETSVTEESGQKVEQKLEEKSSDGETTEVDATDSQKGTDESCALAKSDEEVQVKDEEVAEIEDKTGERNSDEKSTEPEVKDDKETPSNDNDPEPVPNATISEPLPNSTLESCEPNALTQSDSRDLKVRDEIGGESGDSLDTPVLTDKKEGSSEEVHNKPDAKGDGKSSRVVTPEVLDDFAPPLVPTEKILTVVPTYVDWGMKIRFHTVPRDEEHSGRFGYFLQEDTLETNIQDAFLQRCGLYRAPIPRDGNCLFRALAQAIYADQCNQQKLRNLAVRHIEQNWHEISESIGVMDKETYTSQMWMDGTYGGEPEIMVIAQICDVKVLVILGGLDNPVTVRKYGEGKAIVRLIYISDGKYDSGHYDLAVKTQEQVEHINTIYHQWRQIKITELQTWPSYKDDHFYDDSLLHQLSSYIQDKYVSTEPESPDEVWRVGQAVIACYPLDGCFYRAKITSIKDTLYNVFYVDFGNNSDVDRDQLRKDICLQEVPTQCYSCVLYDTRPLSDEWEQSTLALVHNELMDQSCQMEIMEDAVRGQDLVVKLRIIDGDKDVSLMLQENNLARTLSKPGPPDIGYLPPESDDEEESGDEEEREEEIEDEDVTTPERTAKSPYQVMTTLIEGTLAPMILTHINAPNKFYLQHFWIENPDPDNVVQKQIRTELGTLLELLDELRENADDYTELKLVHPGVACCVRYSKDGQWNRGEVLTVERQGPVTMAGVLFVDYGSFEYQPSTRLRELPWHMLDLPAQSISAELAGLVPPEGSDDWPPAAKPMMEETLSNTVLNVLIKSTQPALLVDILSEHGQPIYQPLIDRGVVRSLYSSMDGTLVENESVSPRPANMDGVSDDSAVHHKTGEVI